MTIGLFPFLAFSIGVFVCVVLMFMCLGLLFRIAVEWLGLRRNPAMLLAIRLCKAFWWLLKGSAYGLWLCISGAAIGTWTGARIIYRWAR